jgi:glutamyl-tRNA synthetase
MTVVTRFAPSPTGFLHIGGARTALFNWLYAKHHQGRFLLRIEDTDRARSTQAAIEAIIDGMSWLGLNWDGEIVYQFERAPRHAEVAKQLVDMGKAYYCYTTAEELTAFREQNPHGKFRSPWRDSTATPPAGVPPVVRLKAPLEGSTTVHDKVQGSVAISNTEIDDLVLLRSDGTPTYMLAVVVDDHDMGVTQIIRGDDHFTNTYRQVLIYEAMGWESPAFAHIPLIHGPDGAKLSKRHGALGVDAYRDMGYLPEGLRNYLLRLGWSHGDDEIISTEQAIEWFGLESVGKSPSRFDFAKLENVNGHYIREAADAQLTQLVLPLLDLKNPQGEAWVSKGMNALKQRAKTIKELAESAQFYASIRPIVLDEKATEAMKKGGLELAQALLPSLEALTDWNHDSLQATCKAFGEASGQKLGNIMQPLRAAITGKTTSPSMFEVMEIIGKDETLGRLRDIC